MDLHRWRKFSDKFDSCKHYAFCFVSHELNISNTNSNLRFLLSLMWRQCHGHDVDCPQDSKGCVTDQCGLKGSKDETSMVQVDVGQSRVKSDLLLATSPVLAAPGRSMEATGGIIEL